MSARLNQIFSALADPTRRAILAALGVGERPVSELARPFDMSLPGFMKHLRVLEDAGLVRSAKAGRVVTCAIAPDPMKEAMDWLSRYERFWTARLDALADHLNHEDDPSWEKSRKYGTRLSGSAAASRRRPKKSGAR